MLGPQVKAIMVAAKEEWDDGEWAVFAKRLFYVSADATQPGGIAPLQAWLGPAGMGALIAVSSVIGWWGCTTTARHLGVADPGQIVWDEVVAFWLVLWLVTPAGWAGQIAAFALFRFFDAAKPQPVRWADRLFKGFGWRGGFGILWDDLVAAFCTLIAIALWRHFF